jgi:hypothetical protein
LSVVYENIDKAPLLPVIQIKKNDASTYTFNHFTSTYDFQVRSLTVSPSHDVNGGEFSMRIISDDATNAKANTLITNIDEGNEVTIWIGKNDTDKTKVFLGVIESWEINEDNKNFMDMTISGPDWGSDILKNRVVTGQWVQERDSNGDLVASDTRTTIAQITHDLLTLTSNYPAADITVEDQGVIVPAVASLEGGDIPLSVFNANYEFLDDKLHELDEIAGTIHYIDPDKNFVQIYPTGSATSSTADILLTDDNTDSTATAWPATKVGLIRAGTTTKRTLENHKRRVFGLGGENISIDQKEETDAANTTMDANHIAMRFTPQFITLSKVHVKLSKIGTPNADFVLELREDFNNTPTGEVLRTVLKDKAFLNGTGTTAVWSGFEINEELNTAQNYWIVLRKVGADSSNTFRWHHDNVDNNPAVSATSSDDVTWALTTTPNRYNYTFRSFAADCIGTKRQRSGN